MTSFGYPNSSFPSRSSRWYFRPADCLGCSILGMYLFGGKFCMWADRSRPCTCAEVVSRHPLCRCDRKHFNDIVWALVTVFQVPLFPSLLHRKYTLLLYMLSIYKHMIFLYLIFIYICICIYIYIYIYIYTYIYL